MTAYTHESMLTCAIIWENICDLRDVEKPEALNRWVAERWGANGTAEMREYAVIWAPVMDKLWEDTAWIHGGNEPFDWEFVPAVLSYYFALKGDLDAFVEADLEVQTMAGTLAALKLGGADFESFTKFDTRFVTLFDDGKDGYWDDADPTSENAIRTAMGVYGRDGDGLANHLIDIPFDEHMVNRLKQVMDALRTWLVDNKPAAEEIAA
ncbi:MULTISPECIES: hypothetical protein [unclassified Marinobacter]|uniref:hypothetical protein n=1 Tax=unclassified Marinobacter TaxID=83889 RepID=UPI0012682885|nr:MULTISPECIES: hypothetical protein [unclassified Marinobacter]QFS87573.1 hypothetical protein FIV08_12140 [Marinobacter sp. THAF197a]QFT51358.1 hypothetical protein FIU96_12055 [Marinobacter sp. THAF39]